MKLADLSTGPDWVVYVGFIIFAILSIVLLSGHGSWNVCYSNSSINNGSFENILPAFFVYILKGEKIWLK